MAKKALLIIPPDRFNEDELFRPKEELQKAGIEVTVASTKTGVITGDNAGKAEAEVIFSEVSASDYDVVAVIGGSGTIDHLWGNQELISYLKQAYDQNILVSGICAGSVVVAKTGLLSGRKGTCYPVDVMISELAANNVEYVAEHVVAHKDVITSDGPDGAVEFGQSLVKALA
ncbi:MULTISPECIES: DJ-1/PfpI family protein [Brevibacillus]|jgi:protease I|uniref:Intracellular protease/amidase n=1 Tax=Brevibacillus borstelensis AK1 TaxID=1300222 RepID=M8DES4_9BACL|nr:DJ-1/PfpI family protein [Brevibacillus borstelensis]EMT51922.1 intracellular protease/amidase [Brevibacillus borstelensis AK1]MBE5398273.1 DJ-1/PfpI family protein [Brevibacillus borstelensis]MCC0564757.1 DJ-1/PfpI family protein [Brevibacillus borstelensis]MCM3468807.1 DJ-1/PfpI family protein [Brevibacillus borstelensis]MCM3556996.1 DJ-1/PfpI family protein [Brevibacillus borstelensis]